MTERKLATVLFADLAGSTSLAHEQDPERTRVRLEQFYDDMSREVEAAGGTVEKFAGDAVMAAFGVPGALEDHAERALHTALAMQRRVADGLALRIGVNTGEVVVGEPRAGSSFVSGDAVNVAARLEQSAEPGEILVGERTVGAVRGAFEFDVPQRIEAKGKPEGVAARRLVRALSLMRPRGVGGLQQAFVGREQELERLRAAYRDAVEKGRPKLVTLIGEAGVGKTRLLRELWRTLEEEPTTPLRRTGRCLPYGHGITYWPLGEVVKEHFGILESDSAEQMRKRLGGRELLGVTIGLDVPGDLHPLAVRDRLQSAWVDFVASLAHVRPLVLLIEDLHWAEEPLLDLLERLARDVDGALLLIATARPDFVDRRPGWGLGRGASETIWLEPLHEDDAETLVDRLLGQKLAPSLRKRVVETAEGNPFFVEEVLATLIDRSMLVRRGDGWSFEESPQGFSMPDSVRAVLAARIDLLGEAEKDALQAAAVIGRVFWTGPVYELLDGRAPDFRVLEDRDFVRRRSGSTFAEETEYVFKHALTREVAYESVSKARRARLHARFAEWLERLGARDEHASLLAHHYAEAVRPEDADLAWAGSEHELAVLRGRALAWLRRAAELSVGRYDLEAGIALLKRALALEPDNEGRADLWRRIGRANVLRYDGEAFWAAMLESIELSSDRERLADYYSELAFETFGRGGMWKRVPDWKRVEGWVDTALDLAPPGSPARARALVAKGFGAQPKDPRITREAKTLADALEDRDLQFAAQMALSLDAFSLGQYEQSCRDAEHTLDIAATLSDPDNTVDAWESVIPPYVVTGRFDDARHAARRHVDAASPLSSHHRLHSVAVRLEIEEVAADWETIASLTAWTREAVAENLATPCIRNARNLFVCAAAHGYLGNVDEAERLEHEAIELDMEGYEYILETPRLRLALARDELGVVEELTRMPFVVRRQIWFFTSAAVTHLDALARLRDRERAEEDAPRFLLPGTVLEPFALRTLGVVREDESLLARATEKFNALGLAWHAAQTPALT